jgi:hypothetical protein
VVVGVDVVVGVLVTVTVLVLVLVDAGGTTVVVVLVLVVTLVVDDVVEADGAAITPQASRLPDSPVGAVVPRLSAVWWIISAVPEVFLRSAEVNALLVVTSLAEPSERTCKAVRSPLAG